MEHPDSPNSLIQSSFVVLPPNARVQVAINAMAKARTSCVLVTEAEKLVGILTERDIVRLTTTLSLRVTTTLAEAMTIEVSTILLSDTLDAFSLSQKFKKQKIRHLPVLNEDGQVIGIVTPQSLRRSFKPEYLLRYVRVAEILQPDVICGAPEHSIWELSVRMTRYQVSCIVILENGTRRPIGILTERDVVKFHRLGLDAKAVSAREVMSAPLVLAAPGDSLWAVHEKMMGLRVRRLVIAHPNGELAGIVTQTQMLKVLDPLETQRVMAQMQTLIDRQTRELNRLNHELRLSNQVLSHLAVVDELTQVANRRRLNEFLQEAWERLEHEQKSLSVLICDVDYFKRYNDTYGHLAGDQCLSKIAEALCAVTWRSSDLVARYGGEEFVVVLPGANGAAAETVTRKIQAQIANLQIAHASSSVAEHVTLSIGVVSTLPDAARSPAMLLATADQMLYQAKRQGRNSYVAKILAAAERSGLESSRSPVEPMLL